MTLSPDRRSASLRTTTILLLLLIAGCAESNFELGSDRVPSWVASPETVQKVEVYFWVTRTQSIVVTYMDGKVVRHPAQIDRHAYSVAQGLKGPPSYHVVDVAGVREIYMHPCRDNKMYIVDSVPYTDSDIECDSSIAA